VGARDRGARFVTGLSEETIRTILWAGVALVALQNLTLYALVKLLVSGQGIFVRRSERELHYEPERRASIVGR
jgi:hypothetical protein